MSRNVLMGALAATPLPLAAIHSVPVADTTFAVTVHDPHHAVPEHATLDDVAVVRTYTIRSGDTLSGIAEHFYHRADAWPVIYWANHEKIRNPNFILPGWRIYVPALPHRIPPAPAMATAHLAPVPARTSALSGTLSYGQLEALWESAGGSASEAPVAACIAEHESGGNQYATGAAGERGYWQIMPSHGALSTYNAEGNAHGAVVISNDGTNWSPWTTHIYCGV